MNTKIFVSALALGMLAVALPHANAVGPTLPDTTCSNTAGANSEYIAGVAGVPPHVYWASTVQGGGVGESLDVCPSELSVTPHPENVVPDVTAFLPPEVGGGDGILCETPPVDTTPCPAIAPILVVGVFSGDYGFTVGGNVILFARDGALAVTTANGTSYYGAGVSTCYSPIASPHHGGTQTTIHVADDEIGNYVAYSISSDFSRGSTTGDCGDNTIEPCGTTGIDGTTCNSLDRSILVAPTLVNVIGGTADNTYTATATDTIDGSTLLSGLAGADGSIIVWPDTRESYLTTAVTTQDPSIVGVSVATTGTVTTS